MENKVFSALQAKLQREAVLRAALSGLATGFGGSFFASAVVWLTPMKGLWLSLSVFLSVSILSALCFYFIRFRTSAIKNARRIDRLGLEERMITMVELEKDNSAMARLQREDARAALQALDNSRLKIKIPRKAVIALVVCAVLSLGMTTVNALGEMGLLPDGEEMVDSVIPKQIVTISYFASEGGYIAGENRQVLEIGSDAVTVVAVAEDGYLFQCWSDGNVNPIRTDLQIDGDATYTAEFVALTETENRGDDGSGDVPADMPDDLGQGGPGDETGGIPGGSGSGGGGAGSGGGAWKPNNQIIDGETYYRDVLEDFKEYADEIINGEDSTLTEEEIEAIKRYLGIV